jgi:hypothetical protein
VRWGGSGKIKDLSPAPVKLKAFQNITLFAGIKIVHHRIALKNFIDLIARSGMSAFFAI